MKHTHSSSHIVGSAARSLLVAAFVTAVFMQPRFLLAQDDKAGSAVTTSELVAAMTTQKVTAFAVEDPATPTRFVAALLFPGTQLLIVGAASTSADYLKAQIAQQQHAEVYAALNASAVPETMLFFQDMGCDGLNRDGEQVDVMYDESGRQVLFDGKGKASGLSKNEFAAKFDSAETQYTAMVTLLLRSLRAASGSGGRD